MAFGFSLSVQHFIDSKGVRENIPGSSVGSAAIFGCALYHQIAPLAHSMRRKNIHAYRNIRMMGTGLLSTRI